MDNERSINLGTVYEAVVASELKAHGYKLYYYDNRSKGEVDYHIQKAFVLSKERRVAQKGKIIYIPINYIMFFKYEQNQSS